MRRADLGTRGTTILELNISDWITRLGRLKSAWLLQNSVFQQPEPNKAVERVALPTAPQRVEAISLWEGFSVLLKLVNAMTLCLCFERTQFGTLHVEELMKTKETINKLAQEERLAEDYKCLKTNRSLTQNPA